MIRHEDPDRRPTRTQDGTCPHCGATRDLPSRHVDERNRGDEEGPVPSFNPSKWLGVVDRDFSGGAGFVGGTPIGFPLSGTPRSLAENFEMSTHRGKGPKGYRRPDTRIRDEVCERLTDDPVLDASDIECSVEDGEVTLTGTVHSLPAKRRAEDLSSEIRGVREVQNKLRVQRADALGNSTSNDPTRRSDGR